MIPPHNLRRQRRGMTLLEVMIAVAILVTLFGAALGAMLQVTRTVAAAKARLRAVAVLNLQMEEMRAMPFGMLQTNLTKASFTGGKVNDAFYTGGVTREYTWKREIQSGAEGSTANLVKVLVSVEWDDFQGRTFTISSYSYFSKDGVHTDESKSS